MRETGSEMEFMTAVKSRLASCCTLLKNSGTKSVQSTASTTQMTTSVVKAASQRGTRQPRIRMPESSFTSGLPMTASTAETRM